MLSTANAIVDAKERTQPIRKDTHASPHRRHVDTCIGLRRSPPRGRASDVIGWDRTRTR